MDEQTDRWMEKIIRCGLGTLLVPPGKSMKHSPRGSSNRVKMQTPEITLWFPEQCLLGFFILEKQLASQDVFLIKSKHSITVYLFLVLYRSTSLKSLSFLKNIKTFLCKWKLKNNHSIPSTQHPYNHDSFSKISKHSIALQSWYFLKNINNFLCK